ncbi:MAG: hypothetical protein AB7S61_07980 [Methanoregulaceae archaeon]
MNRIQLLIALAAVAIVGIGISLLLPGFQGGPLTGSIVPMTTNPPITFFHTPTPKPIPPFITVVGSYSPNRVWKDDLKLYDWYFNLNSVSTYDASHLPPGVLLQKVSWSITGTMQDGSTRQCVSQYMERWTGLPEAGIPPTELPLTDAHTITDGYTRVGCSYYGPDLCPPDDWNPGPPFTASCVITTTDGNSYSKSFTLVRT